MIKKTLILLLLILLVNNIAQAVDQGWRHSYLAKNNKSFFAQDKWLAWDKFEHFLAGFGGAYLLKRFQMKDNEIMITIVTTETFWEIKDYFMDWKKYGWIGGDKFSWKDLIATVAGGGFYLLIRKGF